MLYEDFWKSSCNWRKTTIYRSVTNTIENKRTGKRKWLTRKQMLPIFDNDEDIVDGIILRKRSDADLMETEVRAHPEHPDLSQYLVLTEDQEEAKESEKIMDKFMVRERDRGSDSSDSSQSESSGDESSSDDDSDDRKASSSKKGKHKKATSSATGFGKNHYI